MGQPKLVFVGDKFGRLTVVAELDERTKWGRRRYQCLCECGNTRIADTQGLTTGNTKSCGCNRTRAPRPPLLHVGDKFGRLTVIAEDTKIKYMRYFRCRCECGNEKVVCSDYLRNGTTKSCGCIWNQPVVHIGERYGKLTVVKEASRPPNQKARQYECQCDCGNITIVLGNSLRQGNTKSCGCSRRKPHSKSG